MRFSKLTFAYGVIILFVSAAMAFASPSTETSRETLVYATTDKVSDMDPANAYDFFTWELFQNVYMGLMAYAPGTTDLVPGLAESYEVKGDGDIYVFNLRKGVKFTDGTPFTADTVKWSIDRVIALAGDPSWLVSDFVDSVDVIDANTVQFNLNI